MKKLLINIIITIFFSNFFLIKVNARENSYTSPLLIFNNPSLISMQTGLPIGLEIRLNSLDSTNRKNVSVLGGLSYLFENKAIAIGFQNHNQNINILSTGFSHSMLISAFGAGLKVENYKRTILPNIDVAFLLNINKSLSFNVIMKNIFTQYRSKILYPEVSSYIHGDLIKLNFELGYRGIFYDYSKFKPLNSLEMLISYEFFKKKTLYLALENIIYQNKEDDIATDLGIYLGLKIKKGKFNNGISTGYQHNINNSIGKLVNNIVINPLYYSFKGPPNYRFTYKCSQNVDNELVFNIENVDNGEEIKNWSLIITDYEDGKKIIKSFYGGNIPPKLIVWDFKDSFGTVYKNKNLKAQLLLTDKNKNFSVSPVVIISPCYKN